MNDKQYTYEIPYSKLMALIKVLNYMNVKYEYKVRVETIVKVSSGEGDPEIKNSTIYEITSCFNTVGLNNLIAYSEDI